MIVLGARWHAASPPRRRALLPTLAGSFVLLIYTALLVNDLVTGERSQTLLWIASCSLVTVPLAFLAGLLRSRLARAGLSDLFRDLRGATGEPLQATLARALGDPSLVVAYGAQPVERGDRSVARIERGGRQFASLVYDPSLDDDPELVEAVAAAAAIALENTELHAESEARLAELQASRGRIVAAGDAERRRLERNLHDGAQQRLVALAMQLRMIQADIRRDPAAAEALVTSASGELAQSLEELRELARGIHPAVLDYGLSPALESLATRSPVPTAVDLRRARPPAAAGRARRLLRGLRGAGQRRQVRRRDGRVGAGHADRRRDRDRDRRRRRRRGAADRRIRAARSPGPRRGARRPPARHEPRGRGHGRDRAAPLRLRRLTPGIRSDLRETGQSPEEEEVGCPSPPSSSDPCRAR